MACSTTVGVPAKRQLTALSVLQGLILVTIVAVGFAAYRNAMAAQRDRLWVAMAREAAHQMGTPLMSLQGWIEQLRSRAAPPPGLAEHLAADAERLERVAQRFERIGHAIRREPIRRWRVWRERSPSTSGPDCPPASTASRSGWRPHRTDRSSWAIRSCWSGRSNRWSRTRSMPCRAGREPSPYGSARSRCRNHAGGR